MKIYKKLFDFIEYIEKNNIKLLYVKSKFSFLNSFLGDLFGNNSYYILFFIPNKSISFRSINEQMIDYLEDYFCNNNIKFIKVN